MEAIKNEEWQNPLIVKNISKKIKSKKILDDISLVLKKGEIIGLVGENGAGKTTFMKCIVKLSKVDNGDIFINKNYGIMLENPPLYPYLSGSKNIEIYKKLYKCNDQNYIEKLITELEMKKNVSKKVSNYSLGMKQKLNFIQSIMNHPVLLIMDEPFNALDPITIIKIKKILQKMKKDGASIIISSHLLLELQSLCDRVLFMNNGKIVNEIINSPNLKIDLEKEYMQIKYKR